jgi:hypothetical protein
MVGGDSASPSFKKCCFRNNLNNFNFNLKSV